MLFSITAFAQSDFDVAQRFMSKKGVSLVDNKKTRTNSDCSYQISSTTNSINDITYGNTKSTDTYNMLGQKVGNSLEGLPKGVYIMNGKKSVVR